MKHQTTKKEKEKKTLQKHNDAKQRLGFVYILFHATIEQ